MKGVLGSYFSLLSDFLNAFLGILKIRIYIIIETQGFLSWVFGYHKILFDNRNLLAPSVIIY